MLKRLLNSGESRLPSWLCYPLLLAAIAWILFAFHSYLPGIFHSRSINFLLRRSGTYDIILVLWFAGVAYCVGRRFLKWLGVTAAAGAEESALSIAAGAMVFSCATFILSLTHGLYRAVAYAFLVLLTAVCFRELKRIPCALSRVLASRLRSLSWSAGTIGGLFVAVYVSAVLGVILISALGPSYEYDDLAYHLTGPKNFILAHRLVALPDVPLIFLPKNIEMLHTFGMLLHSDVTAKLIVFLCGCVTIAGIFGFLVRFATRAVGMVAVVILASSPLLLWEMRTAHNDVGLALFLFSGVYATVTWLRTKEKPWFRLACIFLAFSLGAKYWAILALGVIVSLVFSTILLRSRALRPAFGGAFKLGIFSSLGLVPWAIISFYYTGNPVFPLLNNIFKSHYWTSAHTNMIMGEMFQGGIRITFANFWDLFRLPWEMMIDPSARFGGNIGPWYVIFIPFLLFFRGIGFELGFLFAFGFLYYAGWAVNGPWVRFLIPALPGLSAGAAFAVTRLLQFLGSSRKAFGALAAIALAILAVLSSPYFEERGAWSRYGNPPIGTLPLKYLSGEESKEDYLHRNYRQYRAVEFLNQIPGDKKVLYVHTLPDGFYLKGEAAFHYSPYLPGIHDGADAEQIHKTLKQHGITHVVVEQLNQDSSPLSSRESDFNHRYLRKLFQRNTSIVYALLPEMTEQTVITQDFMDHLDETKAAQVRPGTPGSAYRQVRTIGDDSRYAMVTEPPSDGTFALKLPEHGTMSFAVGREDPGYTGKGSIQVWLSTAEEDAPRLIYSRDLEGGIDRWIENQVDLSAYAGRSVTMTLRTNDPSGCKYFWADPVVTAPNGGIYPEEPTPNNPARESTKWTVSSGRAIPASVKIGGDYVMSFSGAGLRADLYFDILYAAPHLSGEHVVNNWQYGPSSSHPVHPSIAPGRWTILGVRAHRNPSYHEGAFDPVKITLDITR
jgi:hypothetical protein